MIFCNSVIGVIRINLVEKSILKFILLLSSLTMLHYYFLYKNIYNTMNINRLPIVIFFVIGL